VVKETHTHTPFDNANPSYFSVLAHTTLICTATRVFPSMSTSTLAGCIVTAMPSGRKNSRDNAIARTACRMLSAPTLIVATCFPDRIIPLIAPATWEASLAPATFTCLTSADLSHAHEYHVEPQQTGATSQDNNALRALRWLCINVSLALIITFRQNKRDCVSDTHGCEPDDSKQGSKLRRVTLPAHVGAFFWDTTEVDAVLKQVSSCDDDGLCGLIDAG